MGIVLGKLPKHILQCDRCNEIASEGAHSSEWYRRGSARRPLPHEEVH
jgi:hypothetical protein